MYRKGIAGARDHEYYQENRELYRQLKQYARTLPLKVDEIADYCVCLCCVEVVPIFRHFWKIWVYCSWLRLKPPSLDG